jgi:hypothetical protein
MQGEGDSQPQLQHKPHRRSGWRLPIILILLGGVLVIGGIMMAASLFTPGASSVHTSATPAGSSSKQLPSVCTGARLPIATVLQETADGVHLTVAQVESQVRSGKTIAQVASAQGISPQQLRTIELHALQAANDQWVRLGCITQQDAASNMQRDTGAADYMDAEFTDWFRHP